MKFSVIAVLSAVASAVYAQTPVADAGVAINLPSIGQVVNAGTTLKITWTVKENPSDTINSVALMKGGSANLEQVVPNILSAAIPVNPPTYDWNIPTTVETNPSYVLAFAGSNGATTYSTYFTIMGAAPGTTNNTASAAPGVPSAGASGASASGTSKANATSSATGTSSPSATNAASSLKAGLVSAVGVAGAVALLL